MAEPTFFEHGGLIWIELGPDRRGFTEAFNDGVSALSPRGEPPALSTYWIDYALARADALGEGEITGGNTTRIVRTAGGVRAESDYELFEAEEMPVEELRRLLRAWRERVANEIERADPARPAQGPYQRNPHA